MTLPPKFAEFRFCPKGKNEFSPGGEGILHGKIPGRVMTLPYERTGSVKVDNTTTVVRIIAEDVGKCKERIRKFTKASHSRGADLLY